MGAGAAMKFTRKADSQPETAPIQLKHVREAEHDEMDSATAHPLEAEASKSESVVDLESKDGQEPRTVASGHVLRGFRLAILLSCLFLGSFSIGFDSSCVGTLIPVITNQFHSLHDLGWFQTAYLLTVSAPLLILGRLYTLYSMKTLYIASFTVFVTGSVLTAAAPSSTAFILGRAVSGLGAAGINAGLYIIIAHTTPLATRPIYFGICGAVECTALAFGPLISGTIAYYSTWRVNFWIIVGLGGAVTALIFLNTGKLQQSENSNLSKSQKLERIDWGGLAIELPAISCLVLGLQWAGTAYSWSNWRIILLLTTTGVLLGLFILTEHLAGDKGMVPPAIFRQRSVALSCIVGFCNFAALWTFAYYLPVYFQAVRGADALGSGLMYLPTVLTTSICALVGGPITSRLGYYNPALLLGDALTVIGAALMTTFQPSTSPAKWITYQLVYGMGIGFAFQPPLLAVQTVLEKSVAPIGLVLLNFVQLLGGIITLSVAQNIFLNRLARGLTERIPHLNTSTILQSGATGLLARIPVQYRPLAKEAYNEAIVGVFYIALGLACLATVAALGLEWKSIKLQADEPAASAASADNIDSPRTEATNH